MITISVIVVFSAWLLMTVVFQFSNRLSRFLASIDYFSIFPVWTFFAPNPAKNDFHLIFRDKAATGPPGDFKEVESCKPERSWIAAVWYPKRRFVKVIHDAMSELAIVAKTFPLQEVKLTIPYLTLASYVSSFPGDSDSRARQFGIVMGYGFVSSQEPVLVFVSEFHALGLD